MSDKTHIELTFAVSYLLNGESATDMESRLQRAAERAIGEGLLTGETAAEVDSYEITTKVKAVPQSDADKKSVTAYIEAYACDEHGDGPLYARVDLDRAIMDRIKFLQSVVKEQNLSMACSTDMPTWGPGNIEEEICLSDPEMRVTNSGFWYSDTPNHGLYKIETRVIEIAELEKAFKQAGDESVIYLGNDPAGLQQLVEQHEFNRPEVNRP